MSKKHKHDDHEEHVDESWLIPYADLLTLLLALFIVLYSMNSVDVKKFEEMSKAFSVALNTGSGILDNPAIVQDGESSQNQKEDQSKEDEQKKEEQDAQKLRETALKQEQEDLEKLKKQLDDYIDKNGLTTDLETKLNMSQLMITISDNALFAPAQATVKPESRELAVAIGKMLQGYPDYDVIISGHTDTTPISTVFFKSNWDLSSMRAIRFMDILLENKQLKPQKFRAVGYGEYQPIADNKTTEGKAKNRRVEVSISHSVSDPTNQQVIPAAK
ncbi:flagellar motor protein MotB [Paenibacillus harenae]|uniref:Chemotaxis protein MotB n=1 Tax=Paenibacillus harenae TaxID=306543 RepID=A0ABT9U9K3_PAEHA|nr:flagellar motor protein MotB [Paenibacillus harenae]MDQ0116325.1 chemotaxis protein MotB [Paenibacillus harenae]